MYQTTTAGTVATPARRLRTWLRIFVTGFVLWALTVVVTFLTANPNLVPTLVLLGSFLVPVTFVVWAFGRRHSGEVTAEPLFSTFVTGGVLGGVLFSVSGRRHFALTGRLLLAYLGVSLLHALWNSMHGIALLVTLVLTGTPEQYRMLEQGYEPQQTAAQANVFTANSWGGLALVSVVGIAWLLLVRRHAGREARAVWWHIPLHT